MLRKFAHHLTRARANAVTDEKGTGRCWYCFKVRQLAHHPRARAIAEAGVEPRFLEYTGDSPVAFIIGANLARRHLDKGQKIALALEIEPHFAEEARKRQQEQARRNQPQSQKVENVPPLEKAKSRDQAASAVGVSGKLVSAV